MQKLLSFGKGNAKLGKEIATFSIPSGYTCPGAKDCLAFANRLTGKITDGKEMQFRCFSASSEALFPNVRKSRWDNYELLKGKSVSEMAELILDSLPKKANIIRIAVSGDFYSQDYFDAWLYVAEIRKDVIFYAYTKSLNFWVLRLNEIPKNFKLNASKGGKWDNLIAQFNLKYAEVVFSEKEAKQKKLKIDHTDELAFKQNKSFALLLHGTQCAGSKAASALRELKKIGKGSYPAKK